MNGWQWVVAGYGGVLVVITGYAWSLQARTRAVRRRLDEAE